MGTSPSLTTAPTAFVRRAVVGYLRERHPSVLAALRRGREAVLALRSHEQVFSQIYRRNEWGSAESVSGPGSTLSATAAVRRELPRLLRRLDVRTMLDVPCGDFHWMKEVELGFVTYVGGDVVPELVAQDNERYGGPRRSFVKLDLTRSALPPADVVFCRDCLIHLSYADIAAVLSRVRASGARYFVTTTYPGGPPNQDIVTGSARPIDLEQAPFSFPKPIELIDEEQVDGQGRPMGKALGVWAVSDIPAV